MNANELRKVLAINWRVRREFRGVYPSDRLPKFIVNGQAHAFIINTDPHNKPGEHWVALYITSFGKCIYFDSFGIPPFIPAIQNFISRNSLNMTYNRLVLQPFSSLKCGLYCIYFIYKMCYGYGLYELLQPFNPESPTHNDMIIHHLIRDVIN